MNKEKINRFAQVWAQRYRDHETIPFAYFEETRFIGDGLKELGFEMDAGESLKSAFPGVDAFHSNAALDQVLHKVDLQTLGNAIFSQWRYWNHWATAPMTEADYQWFALAFSRLVELSE